MNATTNNRFKKKSLALLISVALGLSGQLAAAEEVNAEDQENAEEGVPTLIITARKTEENIQRVPVSVSAITSEQIFETGIDDVTDVQFHTPNSTLQVSRATNSTLTAYIRGVGQQDPLWGFEPGVGIYIDDVYIARPQGAVMDILDIDRLEVLRGPQGTLYGKNTIGGAVKYVTREMSGDGEFSIDATIGSFNQRDAKIAAQIPIVEDQFYFGLAYASLQRDGFGNFINTGDENYNKDLTAMRASFEYRPSDSLFFRLAHDNTQDDSNARGGYRLTPSLVTAQQPYADIYDSDTSLPVFNDVETGGTSFTIDYEINDQTSIKYVWAEREGDTYTNIDFDATAVNTFDVPAVYDDEQTTHEIQVNYSAENWRAVFGYYDYQGEACGAFDVILGLAGITLENGGCVDTESSSFYGQANIELADKWSMTIGGRYTKDEKTADVYRFVFLGSVFPEDNETPIAVQSDFNGSEDWSEFTPRIGFEYQAEDDLMYYFSYAEGFKSGGFDMRANESVNPLANEPFDPELVSTYEFGFKSDWFDNNFRLNGALFYTDYEDMQVTVQRAVGQNDFATQVVNAGESEIKGMELEGLAYINDNFNLNFAIGYIDAEFVRVDFFDPNLGQTVDVSDQWVISNTPELSANVGANYTIESSMGDFSINANWAYRSKTNIFEIPSTLDMGSYSLFNIGVNWYHPEGQWKAGLHVKNAFDEEYRVAGYNFPAVFDNQGNLVAPGLGGEDTVTGFYGDPQTIALTIGYEL
ncbi:TonB-dependent receptor [Aliikangiella marina]|uniref:TonB-dependent receptor n=1 Tax=Aliikangiella marina TaxID=1712262 RepID=A0A545T8V3_9GAMM|nr:TonB-dependent receptor [Aliikangiella marina]TQV73646.1 TonB-dependent receptor [Aliikangiella marina]